MKRSFLEQLQDTELLGWQSTGHSFLRAEKVRPLGGEELWNLSLIRYDLASSMFQLYVMDIWQDLRDKQITEEKNGEIKVSSQLQQALRFGKDNAAWYILKEIDQQFKSLHPVHVSRALVGPFENKYLTKPDSPPLSITRELLAEDQNVGLFRFSRQYSYAPNHETHGKELRQIIHRDDWRDEFIICPARYSSRVGKSVLGTNVKILEI